MLFELNVTNMYGLALGHHYEEKDQHYLSAPLFLQALGLCPPKSCHSVVLSTSCIVIEHYHYLLTNFCQ